MSEHKSAQQCQIHLKKKKKRQNSRTLLTETFNISSKTHLISLVSDSFHKESWGKHQGSQTEEPTLTTDERGPALLGLCT